MISVRPASSTSRCGVQKRVRFVGIEEQFAIATARAHAGQSSAQRGGPSGGRIAEVKRVAMRPVTRELVELAGYIAAQAFAVADLGQLGGELAHESLGLVDNGRNRRHPQFLA